MIHTVSILVPVYNASQWLRQCLDSIVRQTYQPLQVVLVDDGSTDDSLAICREYADRYSFVEVYHQVNSGVAVARNTLLDKAKGEFVLFVDSDDWIEVDAVSVMLHAQVDVNADIVVCEHSTRFESSKTDIVVSENIAIGNIIWTKEQIVKSFLQHTKLRGMLWNKLIRRSLFCGHSFNQQVWYGEDAQMIWKIIQNVGKMVFVPQVLYNYRILPTSISGQPFGLKKMTALGVWGSICEDVALDYPQYLTTARARYGAEATLLLYNAVQAKSVDKMSVHKLQSIVREQLPFMRDCDFISAKMLWFARLASCCFGFAKLIIRQ
ncbi:MAG: glycosyltransferase family 2 protein [Alistipes sp.]|nr:glycosyltransferase family 2 protein [Alistipes sp.]